jgi:hypothetical protein
MKPYELFEVLAGTTWRSIERFSRNRIHLGEDAITSINLDALAVAQPSCILWEDTRATESTKGCDFELWIGSSGTDWKRYAVQAKKIHFPSGRYASLVHDVGGVAQIDILDRYANANRALPVYCFYNNSTKPFSWNCPLPKQTEQLGCSVAPSSVVRKAIVKWGGKNFQSIHANDSTIPWRCLVRCPAFIGATATGHTGWPPLDQVSYGQLPSALQRMQKHVSLSPFDDDTAELFSLESQLRPGWVGIIDVGAETDA